MKIDSIKSPNQDCRTASVDRDPRSRLGSCNYRPTSATTYPSNVARGLSTGKLVHPDKLHKPATTAVSTTKASKYKIAFNGFFFC